MLDCVLINPLAIIGKGHAHFIRDCYGGENVASLILPPIELAQVAALLIKNKKSVAIIDASALHLSHQRVVTLLKGYSPEYIGFPTTYGSFVSDMFLAQLIKETLPGTKIIVYGVNVTTGPKKVLDSGFVDFAILGEPETAFLKILEGDFNMNVAYRDKNGGYIAREIIIQDDLDGFPFPARNLLSNNSYNSPFTKTNPFTTMYTARGCSYQCIFCPVCVWNGHRVRYRSIENVIAEIRQIVEEYNIRDIIFRDPVFTVNPERAAAVCEAILTEDYKINWRCFSHAANVNKNLLKLMKRAGCYQISYGFETGSQEILDKAQKCLTLIQASRATQLTREEGIEVSGSFMFGLPGETKETIEETISFVKLLNLDYAQFQLTFSIPGTKLYEYIVNKSNLSIPIDKKEWSWNDWDNILQPKPENFELIGFAIRRAYRVFYLNPKYIILQLFKTRNLGQLGYKIKMMLTFFVRRLI